jgi:hypothetical protein
MTRHALAASLSAALVALLVLAPAADARRAPTRGERHNIVAALRSSGQAPAASCVRRWKLLVSTVNGRYAWAQPTFKSVSCASDGYFFLKRRTARAKKWHIVFNGSDTPDCGLIPRAVLRDLVDTSACMTPSGGVG